MAEHVAGESRAAQLLGLTAEDGQPGPLVPLLDEESADAALRPVLAEIRTWSHEHLGWDRVPDFWRALVRQLGFDDAAVVELAGLVNHYTSFNTISHALQLESPSQAAFAPAPDGQPAGR